MADISISDVTTGVVDGTGSFDNIMKAVTAHLEAQFSNGRITGTDYATVYLGAMQYAIQQSVEFTLREQQADKQAELLTAQVTTEGSNKALVDNQKLLIDEQITETQEKADLLQSQDLEVIAATTRQDSLATAEVSLKEAQTTATTADTVSKKLSSRAELFIAEQKLVTEKIGNGEAISQYVWEIEYTQEPDNTYTFVTIQNLTEHDVIARMNFDPHVDGYTVNSIILNQATVVKEAGESLVGSQIAKTEEEVDVLKQKAITEWAQTQQATKTNPVDGSIIGRQSTLYEQQANGFKWDAQNTHNQNLVNLDKMRMNVSGLVSKPAAGTAYTTNGTEDSGYILELTDPTTA